MLLHQWSVLKSGAGMQAWVILDPSSYSVLSAYSLSKKQFSLLIRSVSPSSWEGSSLQMKRSRLMNMCLKRCEWLSESYCTFLNELSEIFFKELLEILPHNILRADLYNLLRHWSCRQPILTYELSLHILDLLMPFLLRLNEAPSDCKSMQRWEGGMGIKVCKLYLSSKVSFNAIFYRTEFLRSAQLYTNLRSILILLWRTSMMFQTVTISYAYFSVTSSIVSFSGCRFAIVSYDLILSNFSRFQSTS